MARTAHSKKHLTAILILLVATFGCATREVLEPARKGTEAPPERSLRDGDANPNFVVLVDDEGRPLANLAFTLRAGEWRGSMPDSEGVVVAVPISIADGRTDEEGRLQLNLSDRQWASIGTSPIILDHETSLARTQSFRLDGFQPGGRIRIAEKIETERTRIRILTQEGEPCPGWFFVFDPIDGRSLVPSDRISAVSDESGVLVVNAAPDEVLGAFMDQMGRTLRKKIQVLSGDGGDFEAILTLPPRMTVKFRCSGTLPRQWWGSLRSSSRGRGGEAAFEFDQAMRLVPGEDRVVSVYQGDELELRSDLAATVRGWKRLHAFPHVSDSHWIDDPRDPRMVYWIDLQAPVETKVRIAVEDAAIDARVAGIEVRYRACESRGGLSVVMSQTARLDDHGVCSIHRSPGHGGAIWVGGTRIDLPTPSEADSDLEWAIPGRVLEDPASEPQSEPSPPSVEFDILSPHWHLSAGWQRTLYPDHRIKGRIVDRRSRPIPFALIEAFAKVAGGGGPREPQWWALTDRDGFFDLTDDRPIEILRIHGYKDGARVTWRNWAPDRRPAIEVVESPRIRVDCQAQSRGWRRISSSSASGESGSGL